MLTILLGDDDEELTDLLSEYLSAYNLNIEAVHDGKAVLQRVARGGIDLVVLDIMMPELNGIEVLKQLPTIADVPVIMLTAKGDDMDRIIGLELGADDYLPKPCQPRELLARIRAVTKRALKNESAAPAHARIKLDKQSRQCTVDGEALTLTGSEFDMLALLIATQAKSLLKKPYRRKFCNASCCLLTAASTYIFRGCARNSTLLPKKALNRFAAKATNW